MKLEWPVRPCSSERHINGTLPSHPIFLRNTLPAAPKESEMKTGEPSSNGNYSATYGEARTPTISNDVVYFKQYYLNLNYTF